MWTLKDEDIRPVLFDRYESTNQRLRIFEEFCIGKTRADALLVGEKLIGFEIKSDCDSLDRLERQIKDYNRFCDEVYIVAGSKLIEKAKDMIPEYWGIYHVYLDCDNILVLECEREPGINPKVRLTNQFSLLWRSELISIIKKYKIGPYSKLNKMKLKHLIMDRLPKEVAKEELMEELMQRDYSIWDSE